MASPACWRWRPTPAWCACRAQRTLYATGAYDQNLPFADNDRPGVIAARALGRLAFRWGMRPVPAGARVVILDGAPTAAPLAKALAARRRRGRAGRPRRASAVVGGARAAERMRGIDGARASRRSAKRAQVGRRR